MNDLKTYLPSIYTDVEEMDVITDVENELFENLSATFLSAKNNQFINTADAPGISRYEDLLGIHSDNNEDLEFRRQRVLNRFSTTQIFTKKNLQQKLDSILGVNNYTVYIDYNNYTLIVESSAMNQQWYHELLVTINNSKPANIIFINRPLVNKNIKTSESIEYSQRLWNYKLGTTWNLGALPFVSIHYIGETKMSSVPSVSQQLLNNLAYTTSSDVAKVRVNNLYLITTFNKKQNDANVVTIEYTVPTSLGITEVQKIELLDANDNVLTEASIYVPLLEDIILKHTIIITEV